MSLHIQVQNTFLTGGGGVPLILKNYFYQASLLLLRAVILMIMFAFSTMLFSCSKNHLSPSQTTFSSEYARLILVYQKHISPVDGEKCSMYPGCSSYSAQAVEEHGIFKGALMTFDRLLRCGRDTHKYNLIWLSDAEYYYDGVRKKNDKSPYLLKQ